MADLYSTVGTRQNTALDSVGTLVKTGDQVTGKLQLAEFQYTTTGAEATNDVLYAVRLPAGARIIWPLSFLDTEDLGTTVTAKVGTSDDDDQGGTGYALGTAGRYPLTSAGQQTSALSAGTWVIVTLTSVSTPTAAKDLLGGIAFVTAH